MESFLVISGLLIMADENSAAMGKPRVLAELRTAIRARHYSIRTEEDYVYWTHFYVRFHGTRHPAELNEQHVAQFLTHLAVERKVAASTQSQALNAVVFLYQHKGWAESTSPNENSA